MILAIAGLALATLLIGWLGAGRVGATLLAVGWGGLGLVCAWQMLVFALLALAWASILPGRPGRLRALLWGRMVRDAAGNCLPFSRLGGFVLGTRAATMAGLGWAVAAASTVVDMTAEFLAQILFVALGLAILLARVPNPALAVPASLGLGAALLAGLVFLWLQRAAGRALFTGLVSRITRRVLRRDSDRLAVLQAELSLIAGHSGRLTRGILLHFLGWLAAGVAGWIGFRLVGTPIDLATACAIEGLLHGALAISFLVPGNLGVQEAAYVGLASLFGLPPEAALAVSLLRRARDVTVGIPILLGWQLAELRRLRAP